MPIPIGSFYRTCQECGHEQKANDPKGNMPSTYQNAKCRKCKSEALDYGKIKSDPNYDWTE